MKNAIILAAAALALVSCGSAGNPLSDDRSEAKEALLACQQAQEGNRGAMQAAVAGVRSPEYAEEAMAVASTCGESRKVLTEIDAAHPCLSFVRMWEGMNLALAGELQGTGSLEVFATTMDQHGRDVDAQAQACGTAVGVTDADFYVDGAAE